MKHCNNKKCSDFRDTVMMNSDVFCRVCGEKLVENKRCDCGRQFLKFDKFCTLCGKEIKKDEQS
jgi:predicted amidophosphoribosyltransferase